MGGSGELYKGEKGKWGFRVKSAGGDTVATDGGNTHTTKAAARSTLKKLLAGDLNGPITDTPKVVCGQELTKSLTLESDVVCNSGPAFVIAADKVVLDLGGHTIRRDKAGTGPGGPGIVFKNVKNATVRKGTITGFAAGVAINGGSGNTVQNLTVQDNVGEPDGDFGDGITIIGSARNTIQGNTVQRNGPFSGISVVGESSENLILENIVTDNNMRHLTDPAAGRQDMGIRIEGPKAHRNVIKGNTVTGSGADGIVVLPTCLPAKVGPECSGSPPNEHNEIVDNISSKNGTSGRGDGIRLFTVANPVAAAHTTISGNTTDANATNGVSIDAVGNNTPAPTENEIIGNSGHGNGGYDGFDGNVRCGSNIWKDNDFGEVNQKCLNADKGPAKPK